MKLSSGKEFYANSNIFGLTPDGRLSEGYDTFIYDDEDDDNIPLTPAEKCEIAREMITRWQVYWEKYQQIHFSRSVP